MEIIKTSEIITFDCNQNTEELHYNICVIYDGLDDMQQFILRALHDCDKSYKTKIIKSDRLVTTYIQLQNGVLPAYSSNYGNLYYYLCFYDEESRNEAYDFFVLAKMAEKI